MSITDKGCIMVKVEHPKIDDLRNGIDVDDVYDNEDGEYGLETEPHVTILYGIIPDDDTVERLKEILPPVKNIKMWGTAVTIFDNPEYDVLKIDVKSEELKKLNKIVCDSVDYENDYPVYHAHLTLAYLKKGTGKKYEQKILDKLIELKPLKYDYSYLDKHDFFE